MSDLVGGNLMQFLDDFSHFRALHTFEKLRFNILCEINCKQFMLLSKSFITRLTLSQRVSQHCVVKGLNVLKVSLCI